MSSRMRDLPRGTVTFLFTDIEGSTRLLHELGDEYADVLAEHRRVLRDAFGRYGGVEVDTQGDAFFYAFEGANQAVAAAGEVQRELEEGRVRVRIGVHTGEPVVTDEGYVGIDVHRAARIMSAGHGGQVVVSEPTRAQLDSDVNLTDLGLHRLKDLGRPEKLFQLGDGEFPPLKTLDATNLPVAASPLLGRERELAELVPLLQDGTRLLTITGPGGTGKTRLALQVAAELVGSLADGVFWVPLAGLTDPELVLPSIGQTIGVSGDLGEHMRGKQLLLLLDNAEHLLAAAPGLAELLALSPKLRLLVTSRAPLHVSAEREYPLDPLPTTDAVTLFVERARAVGRTVDADATVESICRRLDGLPLAVELAAARAKLLDPQTLLDRLERALPLLTGGPRDAPERQRTLRATIEWSYDLLDDDGRQLFARLSAFAGSFSLQAAEEICDTEVDTLAALVDLSLLKPTGESRFLMLETIREFALERLEESGTSGAVRSRHAHHYLALAKRGEPELEGAEDREWLARLDAERDNFRAAFAFAQEQGLPELALRLVTALRWYWSARGSIAELRRWLDEALERAGDTLPEQRADALQAAALNAYWAGDYDQTERYAQQMLELARGLGDREREVSALTKLGAAAGELGELPRSRALMEEALEMARKLGKPERLALSLSNSAWAALQEGDYVRAAELSEESLAVGEGVLDSAGAAGAHLNLSEARLRLGDPARAAQSAREGLQLAATRRDPLLVGEALLALAASVAVEDPPSACRLIGASAKLREEAGATLGSIESELYEELLRSLQSMVGNTTFDDAYEEGRNLALAEAVELGLHAGSSSPARLD
jgi:predicted ATPase/class 3 adenylate cyclase